MGRHIVSQCAWWVWLIASLYMIVISVFLEEIRRVVQFSFHLIYWKIGKFHILTWNRHQSPSHYHSVRLFTFDGNVTTNTETPTRPTISLKRQKRKIIAEIRHSKVENEIYCDTVAGILLPIVQMEWKCMQCIRSTFAVLYLFVLLLSLLSLNRLHVLSLRCYLGLPRTMFE